MSIWTRRDGAAAASTASGGGTRRAFNGLFRLNLMHVSRREPGNPVRVPSAAPFERRRGLAGVIVNWSRRGAPCRLKSRPSGPPPPSGQLIGLRSVGDELPPLPSVRRRPQRRPATAPVRETSLPAVWVSGRHQPPELLTPWKPEARAERNPRSRTKAWRRDQHVLM